MTNQDILSLNQSLVSLGDLTGIRFVYAIVKNTNLIKPEIEALQGAIKPTTEFQKYDEGRIKLLEQYSKKKDGKAEKKSLEGGAFEYILNDEKGFQKAFDKYKKGHQEIIKAREQQLKDFNELLKEDAKEIKFFKIKFEDIPKEITVRQMQGINVLIEYPELDKK